MRSKFELVVKSFGLLAGFQTEVDLSQQGFQLEDFNDLLFIVHEIGLCLNTLVLNGNFIVELCSKLFRVQCAEIFLLAVDHKEDLPRVSVFGDPAVLRPAEVVDVRASEHLFVSMNNNLLGALCAK